MTQATSIRQVAIVGGTHGNEWTGVYLARKYQQQPELVARSSFKTQVLLGNLAAIAQSQRYLEKDLNRCFESNLSETEPSTYEAHRAREILQQLSPNGTLVDAIIDLHTTTANMGATLILRDHNPKILQLAAEVTLRHPDLKVCCSGQGGGYLSGLSSFGMTLEMGAIAQSTLNAALFQQTEQIVASILDCIDQLNQSKTHPNHPLTIYQYVDSLDYPRTDKGELKAMIHPQLQNRDYEPLNPGDPVFLTFTGETLSYEGDSTVYPIFINEAAYYEKGIAMGLTEKLTIQ